MKHNQIGRLLAAVLLCSMGFLKSWAQQPTPLTLQEAVARSVKNSSQLKYNTAQIAEATAALKEAVERKLPDASVSGSYLRLNNPNINLKVKTGSDNGTGTGGEETASPNPSQLAYGMANVSLPLYAGGRIRYGIESAKYLAEAARLDAENNREGIVLNAIDAFNNLYKSKAAVTLVQENLQSARQRVKDYTALEQNGLLARNDLLKAQLQASNTELALLDAQNNWQLANINMALMLGLPETTELLPDTASFQSATALQSIESYLQRGLQNRKDFAALSLRKKAAATGVKATESEKYPSVALTGGYVAANIPSVFTVTNAVNIGVGLKYSLSSLWKTDARVQQAKARETELAANESQLSDGIRLQIAQAYQAYTVSFKRLDVYKTAVAQATENYRIVNNKYQNNLATTTDVLDADVAQLQARLNLAFAQSDASVAYSRLLHATGQLNETTLK